MSYLTALLEYFDCLVLNWINAPLESVALVLNKGFSAHLNIN